jgi:hypothetical protein
LGIIFSINRSRRRDSLFFRRCDLGLNFRSRWLHNLPLALLAFLLFWDDFLWFRLLVPDQLF